MMTTQTLSYARPSTATLDRPWMPGQLLAVSFLFGPLAAGMVAGLNYGRLGRREMATPAMIAGVVVAITQAVLLAFVVSEDAARPVAMVCNVGLGVLLMALQKPQFDAWKSANWQPTADEKHYKPNGIGKLFLAGIAGLALQVVLVLGLMMASGAF